MLKIERGVDPTLDWRAPHVFKSKNQLMAAAHDLEGLHEIFWALVWREISPEEAMTAWQAHRQEIRSDE